MVVFDRSPAEDSQRRVFRVTSHDTATGMTTFAGLPRALSAHQMAELGARSAQVIPASEVRPYWAGAGRWMASEGAGGRPKIFG
jgi:hypothetical protein